MDDYESLSHSVWDCKYHVVFIPKYRKKTPYGELRRKLGEVFRTLARQKESQVLEGHLMPDYVLRPQAEFRRSALLGTGYFVSTVRRDEAAIREYSRNQETEDKRQDQLRLP